MWVWWLTVPVDGPRHSEKSQVPFSSFTIYSWSFLIMEIVTLQSTYFKNRPEIIKGIVSLPQIPNSYIVIIQCRRPLIFQTLNPVKSDNQGLKYQWFTHKGLQRYRDLKVWICGKNFILLNFDFEMSEFLNKSRNLLNTNKYVKNSWLVFLWSFIDLKRLVSRMEWPK